MHINPNTLFPLLSIFLAWGFFAIFLAFLSFRATPAKAAVSAILLAAAGWAVIAWALVTPAGRLVVGG